MLTFMRNKAVSSAPIGSAEAFDLLHMVTFWVNAQLCYRRLCLREVIWEIPVELGNCISWMKAGS